MTASPKQIPTGFAEAQAQIKQALEDRSRDLSRFPSPRWPSLAALTGPLLPGQFVIVGATPGNGKTTLMLNWFDGLFQAGHRTLFVCTETPASEMRSMLGAMHCDLYQDAVLENDWDNASPVLMRDEAYSLFCKDLQQQGEYEWSELGRFVEAPCLDVEHLADILRGAVKDGYDTVLLDHIHRFEPKSPASLTQEITDVVRRLKGFVSQHGLRCVVSAQLTPLREPGVLVDFQQQPLSALKQTRALGEEANVVLMLHRIVKDGVTREQKEQAKMGQIDARDLIDPEIMACSLVKHRARSRMVGKTARLRVERTGCVVDGTQ